MHSTDPVPGILSLFNIKRLNPMQEAAYKAIPGKQDVLLISPTGSGKTLAFLLPVLSLLKKKPRSVQCLVLAPSRELAIQIEQVWKKMATGYKVSCCYGGHDMPTEIRNLAEPPALLIGTPGRIADHIHRNTFSLDDIETLVLDEFDKSLSLGFEEEMSAVIGALPSLKKKILVSATAGIVIPAFAGVNEVEVLDFAETHTSSAELSLQKVISEDKDKINTLFHLLCYIGSEQVLIFCNHREAVERTASLLKEKGIEAASFHGGMEQMQREQTLIQFRNGSARFLIATDLAARGLDIPEIKHIVHYHLPSTETEFTHRNGRTARMNTSGNAYLIVHKEEILPSYITPELPELTVPDGKKMPAPSEWVTIYINGGKKDKLNKVDIVGFFTQKGELKKEDIGLIIVKDHNAFTAVKKQVVKKLLSKVQNEKIKGTKYRIVEAR